MVNLKITKESNMQGMKDPRDPTATQEDIDEWFESYSPLETTGIRWNRVFTCGLMLGISIAIWIMICKATLFI